MTLQLGSVKSCTPVEFYEISFSWRIENFSLCPERNKEKLESQIFPKSNDQCRWRLWLYPYGWDVESENYLSVFIEFIPGNKKKTTANFSLTIENKVKKVLKHHDFASIDFHGESDNWGRYKFIKRDEILPNLEGDVLVVNCILNWKAYTKNICNQEISPVELDTSKNLSNDLHQVMNKRSFSDITLLSKDGEEFPVHKVILAARSPVFAAMFEHDMKEKQESIVRIQDMSADVLKIILEFIYSSQFDMEKCEIEELLAAADKYDIKDLKILCEEELSKKMSVENAADLLLLADQHNSEILKERALEFITLNLKSVVETEAMKNLSFTRPILYYDIIKSVSVKLCN